MGRKKKEEKIVEYKKKEEVDKIIEEHSKDVATREEYSLLVDPTNRYKFTDEQKVFIEKYIQLRNVEVSAQLSGLEQNDALSFLLSYNVQEEIRRINKAIAHRQFTNKMASLEQMGGYLTSLLTGELSPMYEGAQIGIEEKLQISKMIVEINKLKLEGVSNPSTIMGKNIDTDLNNLSVKTIKSLLENMDDVDLSKVDISKMSPEEIARYKVQPQEITELMNLINKENK